ncbi:MAG: NB-ARC domain-containing protein, partial [Cyanobacteria bacterium J06648_11]
PDVSSFYGRTDELETLARWVLIEKNRLVALLGMGGIGKSTLSVKLARHVQEEFDTIIWRSLRNAPYLDTLMSELVPLLSANPVESASIAGLLRSLRERRCLIVLDNLESILQAGDPAGSYRPGYEAYGDLLRVVGESSHLSCVVLTSREKPAEISTFEGFGAVRSMTLTGSMVTALALIAEKGLDGTTEQKEELSHLYGCSPLALKIVSGSIETLFDGKIAAFLAEETLVFNGVRRLLDRQFDRLAPLERSIMAWLAINRDWTSLNELAADMVPQVPRGTLLESLESLSSRALIEHQDTRYTLQPVVMEYVADRLVRCIAREIQNDRPDVFVSHALTKTTLKEYIYSAQVRAIVAPIALELETMFGSHADIDAKLRATVDRLRQIALSSGEPPARVASRQGYGSSNAIAICRYLQIDMNEYDLSHLTVWQAHLQGMRLQRANLHQANFSRCTFTQSFGSVLAIALSPDGTLLAAGDDSGEIRVWQVALPRSQRSHDSHLGQPILTCRGHDNSVRSVTFSPDGKTLISCSSDQTIRLWDIASGHPLHALTGHVNAVYAVATSRVARRDDIGAIASAGDDGTIRLWDIATGACW